MADFSLWDGTPPPSSDLECGGLCLLCGGYIWVPLGCTRVEDAPDVFIPGTNTHNCEPGRILREHGIDAYDLWRDAQSPGSYISFDELLAELEKFEAEAKP